MNGSLDRGAAEPRRGSGHRLILDHITIARTAPADLIHIAADAGYDGVTLWVHAPVDSIPCEVLRRGSPALASTIAALSATGMEVNGVECFDVTGPRDPDRDRLALEIAAELGAGTATALFFAPLEEDAAADRLAEFATIAGEFGITATVEFMAPSLAGGVNSLDAALRIIARTGLSNVGLTMDVLHLARTGATAASIAAVPPERIAYIQICDGPAEMPADKQVWEAGSHRLYPGEGKLPVASFLAALPRDKPIGIEVPREGEDASQIARLGFQSTCRMLQEINARKPNSPARSRS